MAQGLRFVLTVLVFNTADPFGNTHLTD